MWTILVLDVCVCMWIIPYLLGEGYEILLKLFSFSSTSSSISSSPSFLQSRSRWAQPDPYRELQIPVDIAGPPPRAPDPCGHKLQIAVGTAGPQPRLPGCSGECRTLTATSRSQWALPDLNRDFQVAMGTAGP